MLESRVKDLEKQLSRDQEDFLERLAQKDQDFQSLQENLNELTGEYSELLEIIMLYRVHLANSGISTLVIDTDCTGSCNYHTTNTHHF
jgi:predicted nuclease with TOPRIM domain